MAPATNDRTVKGKKAVVLISGGMDSALCAAIAARDGYSIAALHLDYGQRTQEKELDCFNSIAAHYGAVETLVVDGRYFSSIGGSSLTDSSIAIGKADPGSAAIPSTYVPFRNGNILAIAVSWAEVIGAEAIFIGAMQLDSSGYPDCRREFFEAFSAAVNLGTKPETRIAIITPLMDMTKKDIVTEGMKLGVPFDLTWSCYQDSDTACGVCDSCALRLRGFAKAGVEDPIKYKVKPSYL